MTNESISNRYYEAIFLHNKEDRLRTFLQIFTESCKMTFEDRQTKEVVRHMFTL